MSEIPTHIAQFEVRRCIGEGGMAIVYLAVHPTLATDIVLKELRAFQASDPDVAQRFIREAQIGGSLNHPNIVTVYDYFESNGVPYIEMEYVPHGSLHPFIGHLSDAQMIGALDGVLQALSHAHSHGVVHRDIKPENVLVTTGGLVKLADFGVARALGLSIHQVGRTTGVLGTPLYMAPEQARGQPVGPAADLYSVGIMAWEMLVGHTPFEHSDDFVQVLMRHVTEDVPPPHEVEPGADPRLSDWVGKLLVKSPEGRPASADEALEELERIAVESFGPFWRREARIVDSPRVTPHPEAEDDQGKDVGRALMAVPAVEIPPDPPRPVNPPPNGDKDDKAPTIKPQLSITDPRPGSEERREDGSAERGEHGSDKNRRKKRAAAVAGIGLAALVAVGLVVGLVLKDGAGGVIDPKWMQGARGNITYCSGRDVSGSQAQSVKDFNQDVGSQGLHATLDQQFSGEADGQRQEFGRLLRGKSESCDVYYLDVAYMAEFAAHGWLYDMTPYLKEERREQRFVPATIDTVRYDHKLWGVPKHLDAAVLFYRKDRVARPRTWQDVYREAKQYKERHNSRPASVRYQAENYEGLTCTFLELAYAAGADDIVVGNRANIDQPEARAALQFMLDGIKQGAAPGAVADQREEGSLYVFEVGRSSFMRNWTYAYSRIRGAAKARASPVISATAAHFGTAPLPTWEGGPPGPAPGILGGHDLVISRFSKNPGAALALVDYLVNDEITQQEAKQYTLAPVLGALWNDPDIANREPFSAIHPTALRPRPISPVYWQISAAISRNLERALQRFHGWTPRRALEQAEKEAQQALDAWSG